MNPDTVRPRVLAVVPARGGSKGLPGKNIRPLMGKPLLAHAVALAGLLGDNVRCIVSTDDEDIAEVARESGAEVPFIRPAELASDLAPTAAVLRHALSTAESIYSEEYDMVLLLEPTSPTRTKEAVQAAIDQLSQTPELDGVIAVSEPFFNPLWVGVRPRDKGPVLERYFKEGTGIVRRQDLPSYLRINGNFYVWRSDFIRRLEHSWFDEGVHGYVQIPELHAFSIDDEHEFHLIEAVVAAGLAPLPEVASPVGE
ncbi:acylneuraminate cytidylyltransferase family protein [Arthrobacter globiformis]|uniref:acylneuraminate cytidylyltransferase family protein n=1 Tax=Arthrobacter globiformis TaxID=1665 RepID=UPI00279060AF|nr:acylneuraminate cytidylyltransferase family protein [Arthrobacter globiformis]MDQ0619540.1 CMP-N,N'-diacetyllegionaminic acid synthase [Arthrobacter globiformis]